MKSEKSKKSETLLFQEIVFENVIIPPLPGVGKICFVTLKTWSPVFHGIYCAESGIV